MRRAVLGGGGSQLLRGVCRPSAAGRGGASSAVLADVAWREAELLCPRRTRWAVRRLPHLGDWPLSSEACVGLLEAGRAVYGGKRRWARRAPRMAMSRYEMTLCPPVCPRLSGHVSLCVRLCVCRCLCLAVWLAFSTLRSMLRFAAYSVCLPGCVSVCGLPLSAWLCVCTRASDRRDRSRTAASTHTPTRPRSSWRRRKCARGALGWARAR